MKSFKTRVVALAFLAAGCLLGSPIATTSSYAAPADSEKHVQETSPEAASEIKPLDKDTEIVKIGDKVFTVENLQQYHALRPSQDFSLQQPNAFAMLRGERLENVARHVGAADLMAEKAKQDGMELDEEQLESAEKKAGLFINSILYKKVVTDHLKEASDEELMKRYEEQKDTAFHKEEALKMRHLFVSTYEDYTVKAGDTLESIAEEVAGDKSVADKILSMETKRPRSEGLGEVNENGEDQEPLDPRALVEGEKLKVPLVKGPKVDEAKAKIDEAWKKLEDGGSFVQVAKEYSENDKPGSLWVIKPASQERPIMDSIKDAFFKLEDRTYSEPMRTKHGFQIVYRESYQPEETLPFEDVKEKLEESFKKEQTQSVISDFFAGLAKDKEIVKINAVELVKQGDDASDDDVIMNVGDQSFTRELMKNYLGGEVAGKNDAEIREVIQKVGPVQKAMLDVYIENEGLYDTEEYKEGIVAAKTAILADKYLMAKIEELVGDPTDEEVQAYYDEHKDQQYETPEAYTLYAAAMVDEDEGKAVNELNEVLMGIQNLEDFKAAADKLNPEGRFPRPGGDMGKVIAKTIKKDDLKVIRETVVPGISQVVYRDGEAIAYWVDSIQDHEIKPLEEVKETIVKRLQGEAQRDKYNEIMDEYKALVKVELLVD